jgi:hypothetical protein
MFSRTWTTGYLHSTFCKDLPVLVLSNPCIGEAPALDGLTRNETFCIRSTVTIKGPMGLARVKLLCSHDGVDLLPLK